MRSRQVKSSAFTLIELMISIALVLALMIGVNYVFSSVGQATGLTQAMSRVTREMQGAHGVMERDVNTADMKNAPFVVIRSVPTAAFRDRTDYTTAFNNRNALLDATGGAHSLLSMNDRVHRTDILIFFARDKFSRQTGGGTLNGASAQPYLADMATQEAMIWYGHLNLPNDSGSFTTSTGVRLEPGRFDTSLTEPPASQNPNNLFANQWMLGRVAITLQQPDASGKILTKRAVKDASGNPTGTYSVTEQWYIKDNGNPLTALSPLEPISISEPPGWILEQSRFDLAGTSMAAMRQKLYQPNFAGRTMASRRFQARPFVLGPAGMRLTPVDVALQAPIFLSNCTQFIVEYAGDFLTQDISGNSIPPTAPDGTIDFTIDNSSSPPIRRVRWYGFPRDVDGDGDIRRQDQDPTGKTDVVPLRDYRGTPAEFEELTSATMPQNADYGVLPVPPNIPTPPNTWMYTCAWSPTDTARPSMFRVLVAIDDPNGRFAEPLMFEYVLKTQSGQ